MILLDYKDSRPIYEQVAEKLQELMLLGVLEEDSQMPSVRSLAMELSINPNTIQRAYGELERNGFIYTVKGRGSFVGSIRKLRNARGQELARKMEGLAQEARKIGISRQEFLETAGEVYDRYASDHSELSEDLEESEDSQKENQKGEEKNV
ncbi:GntR family transcriptional regulator [Brotaphodocola sp.]|uniref:GntR family transcriptional regulator n=1 Tax=Brotaphodocola sp. TaxID=3073577 RepID=UPI003D7D9342